MAPIVLKIKGDLETPFNNSIDDLSKTWKVCTKVKDSLENGSRLENLSWRLWFSQKLKKKTKFKVPENVDFTFIRQQQKQQRRRQEIKEEYNTLVSNPIMEDIFHDMQSYLNPMEESPTSQQLDLLINESWPIHDSFLSNTAPISTSTPAFYVAADSTSALPTTTQGSTLYEKLIASSPNTPSTSFSTPYPQHPYQLQYPSLPASTSKSLPPSRATSPPPPPEIDHDTKSLEKAPVCSNCSTTNTPLWRRSADDELLCNACGL